MSEEDLKKIEDYSYTMSTISSATEQDTGIGNLIYKLVQAYKNQQTELEKKDKIIDEMANTLEKCMETNVYDFLNICDKCKSNNEDCHGDYCKDTIKQYFERKVNSNE